MEGQFGETVDTLDQRVEPDLANSGLKYGDRVRLTSPAVSRCFDRQCTRQETNLRAARLDAQQR